MTSASRLIEPAGVGFTAASASRRTVKCSPSRADQAAAVPVSQPDLDLWPVDRCQRIHQVVDVETDVDLLAFVGDLDLFLQLLPVPDVRLDRQQVRLHRKADTAILLVRQDRGTLQRLAQVFANRGDQTRRLFGITRPYSGKAPINQLRSEANIADLYPNVIRPDRNFENLVLVAEDSLQFETPLRGTMTC